ncbi:hypothetical protein [Hyphobacterium marinum]|uniref:Uncharacterized protein n=1 Tax=Hyphobacterium marinum TaxID=3116574 RepID=A0ABU7M0G1_9PROT|nr:hypothetical protein [Hyphobacterium sp. Y6023]MEE2567299.1 hypothetical protein [Hyphobacterium sp. Y6023]
MAKAVFQKHQRVFVKPVGVWAQIEQVKPHWVRDVEEPVRVTYDCGLGRDFTEKELAEEERDDTDTGGWRLMRARNKWQSAEECAHHPFPGSFPVVVTDKNDWGGWRVPGAEYDRDPSNIEFQARLIAQAPALLRLAEAALQFKDQADMLPQDVRDYIQAAEKAVGSVRAKPGDKPASAKAQRA